MSPPEGFVSPLRRATDVEFTGIAFQAVPLTSKLAHLRLAMAAELFAVTAELPPELADEAGALIRGYRGGGADFFALFPVPAWSFLHWLPAAASPPVAAAVTRTATTAHAMALFVHLWDDHLVDGQLAADLLRIQLRTAAWNALTGAAGTLRVEVGAPTGVVEEHTSAYLTACHRPDHAPDLASYCDAFVDQVAIWTLTARLLGRACGGEPAARAACDVVSHFSVAWRLIDDAADVHADVLTGEPSAVRIALGPDGRDRWDECRRRSAGSERADAASWRSLVTAIRESGCLADVLARAAQHLDLAAAAARGAGWQALAHELDRTKPGPAS